MTTLCRGSSNLRHHGQRRLELEPEPDPARPGHPPAPRSRSRAPVARRAVRTPSSSTRSPAAAVRPRPGAGRNRDFDDAAVDRGAQSRRRRPPSRPPAAAPRGAGSETRSRRARVEPQRTAAPGVTVADRLVADVGGRRPHAAPRGARAARASPASSSAPPGSRNTRPDRERSAGRACGASQSSRHGAGSGRRDSSRATSNSPPAPRASRHTDSQAASAQVAASGTRRAPRRRQGLLDEGGRDRGAGREHRVAQDPGEEGTVRRHAEQHGPVQRPRETIDRLRPRRAVRDELCQHRIVERADTEPGPQRMVAAREFVGSPVKHFAARGRNRRPAPRRTAALRSRGR